MLGNLFDRLAIFSDLSPAQQALLRQIFVPVHTCAGELIFNQGEWAEYLYLLVEGEVCLRYKPEDGPELIVAHVRATGIIGWSTALGNPTYTSAAISCTDCDLLRVHGDDLRDLCERHPETGSVVLERLADIIAERLRKTHPQVVSLLEQGLRIHPQRPVMADMEGF